MRLDSLANTTEDTIWAKDNYHNLRMYQQFLVRRSSNYYVVDVMIKHHTSTYQIKMELDYDYNLNNIDYDPSINHRYITKYVSACILLIKRLNITRYPFNLIETFKSFPLSLLEKLLKEDETMIDIDNFDAYVNSYQIQHNLALGNSLLRMVEDDSSNEITTIINGEEYKLFFIFENNPFASFSYQATIRIGDENLYIVKNLKKMISSFKNESFYRYGTKLGFKHHPKVLDEFSQKSLQFITSIIDDVQADYTNSRFLVLDDKIDEFFDLFYGPTQKQGKEYLNIKLAVEPLKFNFDYEKQEDNYLIKPFVIADYFYSQNYYYHFDGETLTRYQIDNLALFKQLDSELSTNKIMMDEADYLSFVDSLKVLFKDNIVFDNQLGELPCYDINIYADVLKDDLVLKLLVNALDVKQRDVLEPDFIEPLTNKAKNIIRALKEYQLLNYEKSSAKLVFPLESDKTINLIRNVLPKLQEYCSIYISDSLKTFNPMHSISLDVGVKVKNDLLEIDLSSINLDMSEIEEILKSYQKQKKYYQLKSGEIISLENDSLAKLDSIYHELDRQALDHEDNTYSMPLYNVFKMEQTLTNYPVLNYERDLSLNALLADFETTSIDKMKIKEKYDFVLKDYQKYGVKWLMLLEKYGFSGILADDMGLGKTIQTIAFLESGHQKNDLNIIICPASLMLNWQDELNKFSSSLNSLCVHGSYQEREKLISTISRYDVIITTYDYLKNDLNLYQGYQFNHIVIDEAQYIKNHTTKAAQTVKLLQGKMRIALTGTPIENSLAELWSIFDFLMPTYLDNYHYFKVNYEVPIVKYSDEEKQGELKRLVEPFILRRRKQDVLKELPDKIEQDILINFSKEEEKLYLAKLAQVNLDLQALLHKSDKNKMVILKMLTELRQICCEPRVLYENINEPSSKMKGCLEIIESLKEHKKPVLVFSFFTSVLSLLEEELLKKNLSYLKLTGSNNKEERKALVDEFQKGDIDVFLISLKAGGTGLNLTQAKAVIHFDPWWNLAAQNQATDRTHRIGQTNEVQVFNLIVKNSIEEKIIKLQAKKKDLVDVFIENSSGSIASMTTKDIIDLLKRE